MDSELGQRQNSRQNTPRADDRPGIVSIRSRSRGGSIVVKAPAMSRRAELPWSEAWREVNSEHPGN